MDLKITKEEADNLQLMADKLRDYVFTIFKDEKLREEMCIAIATQFFIYSLQKDASERPVIEVSEYKLKIAKFVANCGFAIDLRADNLDENN